MRKILQISADNDGVWALCSDGTVWYRVWEAKPKWQLIESPPDELPWAGPVVTAGPAMTVPATNLGFVAGDKP